MVIEATVLAAGGLIRAVEQIVHRFFGIMHTLSIIFPENRNPFSGSCLS
jgi:hypothetical protein